MATPRDRRFPHPPGTFPVSFLAALIVSFALMPPAPTGASARAAGKPAGSDKEVTMLMRREFDLPAVEAESDLARGLMDAGLLQVIEPGDEVIGVAITLDPEDFDQVFLLARSCGLKETMLDGEIYDLVTEVAAFYREHPALDRFRRTPEVQPGDSDEAIDLDLRELSDR